MLSALWIAALQAAESEWPDWLPWVAILVIAFVAGFILTEIFDSLRTLARKWKGEYGGEEVLNKTGCERLPLFSSPVPVQWRVEGKKFVAVVRGQPEGIETVVAQLEALEGETYRLGTLVCLRLPGRHFPRFELAGGPDDYFARRISLKDSQQYTRLLGMVDVQLEGNPSFAKFFSLTLYDLDAAEELRRILSREIQDWLMLHRDRTWRVEGAGEWVSFLDDKNPGGSASAVKAWLKDVRPLYDLFARATEGSG